MEAAPTYGTKPLSYDCNPRFRSEPTRSRGLDTMMDTSEELLLHAAAQKFMRTDDGTPAAETTTSSTKRSATPGPGPYHSDPAWTATEMIHNSKRPRTGDFRPRSGPSESTSEELKAHIQSIQDRKDMDTESDAEPDAEWVLVKAMEATPPPKSSMNPQAEEFVPKPKASMNPQACGMGANPPPVAMMNLQAQQMWMPQCFTQFMLLFYPVLLLTPEQQAAQLAQQFNLQKNELQAEKNLPYATPEEWLTRIAKRRKGLEDLINSIFYMLTIRCVPFEDLPSECRFPNLEDRNLSKRDWEALLGACRAGWRSILPVRELRRMGFDAGLAKRAWTMVDFTWASLDGAVEEAVRALRVLDQLRAIGMDVGEVEKAWAGIKKDEKKKDENGGPSARFDEAVRTLHVKYLQVLGYGASKNAKKKLFAALNQAHGEGAGDTMHRAIQILGHP